eukprot:29777-Pyramimonas_sp.AAC.1
MAMCRWCPDEDNVPVIETISNFPVYAATLLFPAHPSHTVRTHQTENVHNARTKEVYSFRTHNRVAGGSGWARA